MMTPDGNTAAGRKTILKSVLGETSPTVGCISMGFGQKFLWVVLLSAMCRAILLAQADLTPAMLPDIPMFSFDALGFSSSQYGESKFDVYIEVPYDVLHFTKDDRAFRAGYEITLDLYDMSDRLVDEKWWKERVEAKDYEQSVSPHESNLSQQSFDLAPGEYQLAVQVKDNETSKVSRMKRKVVVRDFATPSFELSDIMLARNVDTADGKEVVFPNISGNVGELKEGFFLFFETYNRLGADSARFIVSISNVKGDVVQSDTFNESVKQTTTSVFHREKCMNLFSGDYVLDVKATPFGPQHDSRWNDIVGEAVHPLVVRWHQMPVSITDLDVAIDELRYVASRDKIEEMKKAPSDKKRQLFVEFWKKRDPTPNTEQNELMDEYYARVDYADKHFGHYMDGWKTDMGMVYIIFGAPDNIERHPFEIDSKPYEVWTYYNENREFIFVDATGFGDYRLQNPIWDLNGTRPR